MTFSKKQETTQSTGSTSSGDWDTYNEAIWDAFDVDSIIDAKGKEVKSGDVIGVLNYIQELGNQPQAPASMKSNVAAPKEGEDNSPEELARLVDFPNNWFAWEDEWKDGKKTSVRKVLWNQQPQETLVLAVDFPDIKVDYGLHPMADGEGSDIKSFRIDYNGKYKGVFERTVSNEVQWKTGKFGDKDVKYKIATACGILKEYQDDGHDLAHLVQATCNWEVVMTKNVNDGKTYYNIKIKNPSAIQDIKTRKETYTIAEQLEDTMKGFDIPFTGILFDAEEDHYSKDQLQGIRGFWLDEAKKAVQIDKNEGTNREGTWLFGVNWVDSGLAKACKKFGIDGNSGTKLTTSSSSQSNTTTKTDKPSGSGNTPKVVAQEPVDDYEDDIPFAPIGLMHNNMLLHVM